MYVLTMSGNDSDGTEDNHRGKDIEIPWNIVREFSRASLPQNKQVTCNVNRATPEYDGYSKLSNHSKSRFPSLPVSVSNTPDLNNGYKLNYSARAALEKQKEGRQKVVCNVLQTYVLDEADVVPDRLQKSYTCTKLSVSNVNDLHNKSLGLNRSSSTTDISLTPSVQSYREPRDKNTSGFIKKKKHSTTSNPSANNTQASLNFPKLSPVRYIHNYKETWSPIEEKKLADMWKQGTILDTNFSTKPQTSQSVTDLTTQKKEKTILKDYNNNQKHSSTAENISSNHIYKFSKHTEGWGNRALDNHYKRHKTFIVRKSEPPSLCTTPDKYITTWLEAGGEIPCFLKSNMI